MVRPGPSIGCHLARLVAPVAVSTTRAGPCPCTCANYSPGNRCSKRDCSTTAATAATRSRANARTSDRAAHAAFAFSRRFADRHHPGACPKPVCGAAATARGA